MKRVLLLCLLVAMATWLAADQQVNTFDRRAIETEPGVSPQPSRYALEFSFSTAPVDIQTTYFDYMPGSYNSCPIRVLDNNAPGNNSVYMLFHGMETASGTRREYIAYWNPTSQNMQTFYSGNTDCREGYGGISLDWVTQDPLTAWHIDPDGDAVYDVTLNYDMWHFLQGPGLLGTPVTVIPNGDWSSIPFNPPFDDDEFIWPYVYISESPTFATDGSRRVYVVGNNSTAQTSNPSENVLICYADFTTSDLEEANMGNLDWHYVTIPLMDSWNAGPDWIRPFHCETVSRDGKFAIIGNLAGDDPPINLAYPDMFVLWNDNFAEGDWEFISTNSEQFVDNPVFSGEPYFDSDSLHFSFTHSGHFSTDFDSEGRLHMPSCFALNAIDTTGEGIYYPWFLFMRDIVFDPAEGEFVINNLYPRGDGPANEPFLPWDPDYNGVNDSLMVNGWPISWYVADDAFHENIFKIASDRQHQALAAVWVDGLKSRWYNEGGDEDYASWASAPEIYISMSVDNGDTWSEPLALNALDTPELDGMIPVYAYPGDRLEYLGNNTFRMHLFFLDDNSYGAFAQNGNGANDGGTLMYAALDITSDEWSDVNDDELPAVATMLQQNHPNPFNPETTISYSLPVGGQVELAVYNIRGERVKTLVNESRDADSYTVTWTGDDDRGAPVASGVYFYQLKTAGKTETRKMLLLK